MLDGVLIQFATAFTATTLLFCRKATWLASENGSNDLICGLLIAIRGKVNCFGKNNTLGMTRLNSCEVLTLTRICYTTLTESRRCVMVCLLVFPSTYLEVEGKNKKDSKKSLKTSVWHPVKAKDNVPLVTVVLVKDYDFAKRQASPESPPCLSEMSLFLLSCFLFGAGGSSPTGCWQNPRRCLHGNAKTRKKTDFSQLSWPPYPEPSRWQERATTPEKLSWFYSDTGVVWCLRLA